jgi:Na+-driven multidrug efflux pump
MESAIGKLIAKKEQGALETFVRTYEWSMNVISTIVFVCTSLLIVPFMKVYTANVTDVNYIQPALGYWLVIGAFFSCIRLPYQNIVESAGHFRETRNGAIVEAVINIGLSLLLIKPLGSVGVAIGTAVAMAFRTLQYAVYSYKHIVKRSWLLIVKRLTITGINAAIIIVPFFVFGIDNILICFR